MIGVIVGATLGIVAWAGAPGAQAPQAAPPSQAAPSAATAINAERSGEAFTLTFFNRPIVVLRARVLGGRPSERAQGAERILESLVENGVMGPVTSRPFDGAAILTVGSRGVLVLTPLDVEELAGETFEGMTAQAVARLQVALDEAAEARRPRILLRSAALALVAVVLAILALWGLARGQRVVARKLVAMAEQRVTRAGLAPLDALRTSRALDFQRHLATAVVLTLDLVVIYAASTFVLKRFPYTRPWGESMSGFLLTTVENLGLGIAHALPGLFTAFLIFAIVRFVLRLVRVWFDALERGQATARWIYPDTAQPTRRLITALLWLFAIVVAYPYLPGSQTEAFKGVSVFLGLLVTFGSSGLVNQIMSGFMITYSRALHVGDFVKIGDVEGTVIHLGVLSTRLRTLRHETVTVPNAVVVSQTTTDFTRKHEEERVLTPTSVTIGYDAPWRQVHSLLLRAAERTPGLLRDPQPVVLQAGLEDFYVRYTLFVSLERQESRLYTLDTLHANIQDLFNEYGVQIMSPNYVFDPAAPKVVPKTNWFAAPARIDPPAGPDSKI